jgi:O-antigen/teichoic acid export membrane protein
VFRTDNFIRTEDQKGGNASEGTHSIIKIALNAAFGLGGNAAAILLRLATSLIITRALGPEIFGIYVLAIAIIIFTEMLALAGMEHAVVKFVSQFKALDDIPRLRGTVFWSTGFTFVLSSVLGLALFLASPFIVQRFFSQHALIDILRIMSISIPFSTLSNVFLSSLQALKLVKYKIFVWQILLPLCRLLFVSFTIAAGYQLKGIAGSYVLAIALGFIFSIFVFLKHIPEIAQKGPVIYEKKELIFFTLPLFCTGLFHTIIARADLIIMGYFLPSKMIGIYGISQRFLPLIAAPLASFNKIFAPIISDLFSQKKLKELEYEFKIVTKWVLTVGLPIFTLLIFFSKEIMSLFGSSFVAGSQAMVVLCFGQLINISTGSVGFMLMMTGRPHANLFNSVLLCLINILLNIYLIPRYGILGAAFASTIAIGAIQLLRLGEVWYFLHIHPYRRDLWKPVLSCVISLLILFVISRLEVHINRMVLLVIFPSLFLSCYTGLLYLFRLSPEDRITMSALKDRISSQGSKTIRSAMFRQW